MLDDQPYLEVYEHSITDPESFWGEIAQECHWFKTKTNGLGHRCVKGQLEAALTDKSNAETVVTVFNTMDNQQEVFMANQQSAPALGNPAVVGLAGFGLTTMILQFHNLGWCGMGPIIALGLVFGGIAQMIAGFQEFKCGNNFGYSAFVSYGAFWIALSVILLLNHFGIYKSSGQDIGFFLVVWTLYTAIMWVAAMRIHAAMASTFTLLLIGFILLDLAHFGYPAMTKLAAYVLIVCALNAWYMMAHVIFLQVFGMDILPVGKPWIDPKPRPIQDPIGDLVAEAIS